MPAWRSPFSLEAGAPRPERYTEPSLSAAERLKWLPARLLLSTVGRLSEGIRTGFRYGFSSGEMLDYVYENHARGQLLLGRLIDRLYLNAPGWRGIRERRQSLVRTLAAIVLARQALGRPTRILDVAAGPGRYLLDVAVALGTEGLEIECRDLDEQALELGRTLAAQRRLTNVTYRRGNALDPAELLAIRPRPDVVVVSGLYEILLDDAAIRTSLSGIAALLPPDGMLVLTGQPRHPQLGLIRNLLRHRDGSPWVMRPRSVETLERWCRAAGFTGLHTTGDTQGIFTITVARKARQRVP
jgi:SAM-dependent methyltransferase